MRSAGCTLLTPLLSSTQRLSQRLWKQAGAASELDDGDDASAAAPLADQRQPLPPPALVPPFVLSRAAARLCPPRVTSDGKPMPLPHGQNSSSLLDGWQLLMPERWAHVSVFIASMHKDVIVCLQLFPGSRQCGTLKFATVHDG